jgi:hypothetical protein
MLTAGIAQINTAMIATRLEDLRTTCKKIFKLMNNIKESTKARSDQQGLAPAGQVSKRSHH